MDTDKLLIRRILEGRGECFAELINKYYPRVVPFFRKLGATREDAEDMAQELFIKVYNNLYKYDERWNFSTWLYKVAINNFKDMKRSVKGRMDELDEEKTASPADEPEEYLEKLYRREMVRRMLFSLREDVRIMLVLHYGQGFSLKEIGRMYGLSSAAVKMKLFRARNRLAERYGPDLKEDRLYEV